ncbi:leucine-rich repeat extensin-like protein 3 [Diospyros lotus]|uniref:leucine-rich repeat extensin-like protein 3 n=1 Tax=Diospyros lotus TaxID=55363 RepID=UPI002250781B|nr:leucine-rich repeat extensin-like protein 3 [Diospyros lotus]
MEEPNPPETTPLPDATQSLPPPPPETISSPAPNAAQGLPPRPPEPTPPPAQIANPNAAESLPPGPPETTPPTQTENPKAAQSLPPQPPETTPPPAQTENPKASQSLPPQPPETTPPPAQTENPKAAQSLPPQPPETTPPPAQTENPKAAQSLPPQPPETTLPSAESANPSAAQSLPPRPPAPPSLPANSKKRPLDQIDHIKNSRYFKMRAVLKDLRPHFIEVLRTPDIQNCKAAHEIREQMKILMDLYKEMTTETISITKCNYVQERPVASELQQDGQKSGEPSLLGNLSEKLRTEDSRHQGTFVVGGSAFGWNFITYPGKEAVYYGRTKDVFRSANVILEKGTEEAK